MRPLKLLAVGLALALALLAWRWTRPGSEDGPDELTEAARTEMRSPVELPTDGLAALPDAPSMAAHRTELGTQPNSSGSCRIRVLEAGSRAPVPGAHVWIQREDVRFDSPAWSRAMRRSNDVEPVLRSGLGLELTLDAEATVLVPRPGRALVVAAASGVLHGEGLLEPDEPECVVELTPYHALAIEVVDREARPVPGALVALYWGEFNPLMRDDVWIADEAGRVWIPKLEDQLYPAGYRGTVRVSLAAGVTCEPELVLFTPETTPDSVRLVAGDFGRLVVQLVDAQGAELALDGRAWLEREDEALEPGSLATRAGRDVEGQLVEGRVVFASVGLGRGFELRLAADGHETIEREFRGPTQPGEELRVSVPLGTRQARVRGRVVGIRASFGGQRSTLSTWATARLEGRPVADAFACFEAGVQEGQPFDRPVRRELEAEALAGPWLLELATAGTTRVLATVVPRFDAAAGVVDLGEVRFEPEPELARVRVVDPEGAAVRAEVEIEAWPDRRYERTDEHGALRLTGSGADLRLRMRATHRDWLESEWAESAAPGGETTLTLRRGARLEGSAILPRGAALGAFELVLSVAPSASLPKGARHWTKLVEGGRFRFPLSEPGRARLVVTHEGVDLVVRDGIELVAGETTRLEPLDLAALLHPFALSVALASGEPWLDGQLEVCEPDGTTSGWTTRIGPAARVALLAPRPSLDLWVVGRGARATLFEGVSDGDRLVLPAAPALRLRLPPGLARPEPPLTLVVLGTLTDSEPFDTYYKIVFEPVAVGADGSASLRPPWPGAYELTWSLRHDVTGAVTAVKRERTQTVLVGEASAPAEVEVELTAEELAAAVRAAGG